MSRLDASHSRLLRLTLALALAAGWAALGAPVPIAHAVTTYTVDTEADTPDATVTDFTCNDGSGHCSLRAALEQAAWGSPPFLVTFSPALAGRTFLVHSTLIMAGLDVTLDGLTLGITISGSQLGAGQSLLVVRGSYDTVRNLTFRDSKWDAIRVGNDSGFGNQNVIEYVNIVGSAASAIYVFGSGGAGQSNIIQHSRIGTTSSSPSSCVAGESNAVGISVGAWASSTQIDDCTVVCSAGDGIRISSGATYTHVEGSRVGMFGAQPLPNGGSGIHDEAANTLIAGNTISGNAGYGIQLAGSSQTSVRGNRIGTDSSGNLPLPNGSDGVILSNAQNCTVGGAASAGYRNIISGNTLCGVAVMNGSSGNIIDRNLIGLGSNGGAVPNGLAGVAIIGAPDNTVGWSISGGDPVQVIAGNAREGLYILDSSGTQVGNGTAVRDNGREGIFLIGAANTTVRAASVLNNGLAGVAVAGTGSGNSILVPVNYGNGGLPVDLGNDGPTPNDPGDADTGPNDLLNYPELRSVDASGLHGLACPGCAVHLFRAHGNPAASHGGVDGLLATVYADGTTGAWSATYAQLGGVPWRSVALMALDFAQNSSELRLPLLPSQFLPLVVR